MADTQRTRAQLLVLMADNVTGQISPQDLRDMMVSIMEEEFKNPGDFWSRPQPKYKYTDKSAWGWIEYSQFVYQACSFGNIMTMDESTGGWYLADAADSALQGLLGMAMDSYVANESQAEILKEGLVCNSVFSTVFSRYIGRPVYLDRTGDGSITVSVSVTSMASYVRVGAVVISTPLSITSADSTSVYWYFNPEWAVISA